MIFFARTNVGHAKAPETEGPPCQRNGLIASGGVFDFEPMQTA